MCRHLDIVVPAFCLPPGDLYLCSALHYGRFRVEGFKRSMEEALHLTEHAIA